VRGTSSISTSPLSSQASCSAGCIRKPAELSQAPCHQRSSIETERLLARHRAAPLSSCCPGSCMRRLRPSTVNASGRRTARVGNAGALAPAAAHFRRGWGRDPSRRTMLGRLQPPPCGEQGRRHAPRQAASPRSPDLENRAAQRDSGCPWSRGSAARHRQRRPGQ
jgi:hypothetical protein